MRFAGTSNTVGVESLSVILRSGSIKTACEPWASPTTRTSMKSPRSRKPRLYGPTFRCAVAVACVLTLLLSVAWWRCNDGAYTARLRCRIEKRVGSMLPQKRNTRMRRAMCTTRRPMKTFDARASSDIPLMPWCSYLPIYAVKTFLLGSLGWTHPKTRKCMHAPQPGCLCV